MGRQRRSDELSAREAQAKLRDRVRSLLAEQGMRHRDLAEVLGLAQTALSQRMTGNQWFSDSEIAATAAYLSVDVPDLMAGSYRRQDAHQGWVNREAERAKAADAKRRSPRALCCQCGTLRLIPIEKYRTLDGGSLRSLKGRYVGGFYCESCAVETPHAVLRDMSSSPDELEQMMTKPTPQQIAAVDRDRLMTRLTEFNVDVRYRRMASRKQRIKDGTPIVGFEFDASKSQWRIEINPDAPASIQLEMLTRAWEVISTDEEDYWNNGNLGTREEGAWTYAKDDWWASAATDLENEIARATVTEKLKLIVAAQDDIASSRGRADA